MKDFEKPTIYKNVPTHTTDHTVVNSPKERLVMFTDYVPWADINKEYKWFARNENGDCFLFKNMPRLENRCYWVAPYPPCYLEQGIDANVFSGFARGTIDWKNSLQERV